MNTEQNWTVQEFAGWWLKHRPLRPPFEDAIYQTDMTLSLCLYRHENFQVELYIMKPNETSKPHSHPGVDSYFVYLGGNLEFGDANGEFKDLSEFQKAAPSGAHILLGRTAEAINGEPHSVRTFKEGGSFLSFERWHDKKPNSVAVNWKGDPVGEVHAKTLGL
jgi:hypothetical protein